MSKGTKWLLLQKWLQMGAVCHHANSKVKRRSEGRKEGEPPVSGSVTPGLASQRGIMLGARSQACCHAEAFTGTQRKIERCWQQVGCLIHPGTISIQPSSLLQSEATVVAFRTHIPGLAVRLSNT